MALTRLDRVGDGTTTLYDVSFDLGFISKNHIYVYLDGSEYTDQLDYVWVNSTQIQLNAALASGVEFAIRRIVPRDDIVNDYENGAILREKELDNSFKQAIMILQEIEDGYFTTDGNITAAGDITATNVIATEEVIDGEGNKLSEKMAKRPLAQALNIVVFGDDGDSEDSGIAIDQLTIGEGLAFSEVVSLLDGQTIVVFGVVDTELVDLYLSGDNVDSGLLTVGNDYTITSPTTIELYNSCAGGTKVTAKQRYTYGGA